MSEKCRFRVVTARRESVEAEGSERSKNPEEEGEALPTPHLGMKRRYHDDGVGGREEMWSLHDVIFTDRVQSVRVGRVVKIDGLFAAVHFPGKNERGRKEGEEEKMEEEEKEGDGLLDRCRLLRKDDLVVRLRTVGQFPRQLSVFHATASDRIADSAGTALSPRQPGQTTRPHPLRHTPCGVLW